MRRAGEARKVRTGAEWGWRRLLGAEGAAGVPAAVARSRALAGQLLGQLQQRVRRAGDHVGRDIDHPPAAVPRGGPELLEGLPGTDPVALGQDADRLLDADPRGQRVLKLAHGGSEPVRLVLLLGLVGHAAFAPLVPRRGPTACGG